MNASILLVEDDPFSARIMELQFAKHNYQVQLAKSGQEALGLLEQKQWDLLITDINMPNISGLELLESVRKSYSKEELPVLMLTATSNDQQMVQALELGANDFLIKSKAFRLILARVELHLRLTTFLKAPKHRSGKDALWNWDLQQDKMHISPNGLALLGLTSQELGDYQAWRAHIHVDDMASVSQALEAHHRGETSWFEADYRMRHKNGGYLWVHSFGVTIFGKTGQPRRVIGSWTPLQGQPRVARFKETLVEIAEELSTMLLHAELPPDQTQQLRQILTKLSELV